VGINNGGFVNQMNPSFDLHQSTIRPNQRTIFKPIALLLLSLLSTAVTKKEIKNMTRHKTVSSLSVAATAILFAAIPCFAQAQHDASGTATAIDITQPTLAMNRDLAPKRIASSTRTSSKATQPKLSEAMFTNSVSAGQPLIISPEVSFEPRADISKKQFSADDYSGPAPRPRVTFVPSRGQKLPNS